MARASPTDPKFSGFVFKIQANMDPAHRDRIAFMRVVSGRYVKGMSAFHSRLGKDVRLAKPSQFLAAERTAIEDAWPGDVIGLFDPGMFRIGDTLAEGAGLRVRERAALLARSTSPSCAPRTRCAASRWRRGSSSCPRRARCRSSSSSGWG